MTSSTSNCSGSGSWDSNNSNFFLHIDISNSFFWIWPLQSVPFYEKMPFRTTMWSYDCIYIVLTLITSVNMIFDSSFNPLASCTLSADADFQRSLSLIFPLYNLWIVGFKQSNILDDDSLHNICCQQDLSLSPSPLATYFKAETIGTWLRLCPSNDAANRSSWAPGDWGWYPLTHDRSSAASCIINPSFFSCLTYI